MRAAPEVSCAIYPKEGAHEHTGAAENIRHSLRNGFTTYNVLSPENGSFASVAPQETVASGCIDASTATSGPHAFAVRVRAVRQRHFRVHRSPPLVVTMANAPLSWTGCMRYSADFCFWKSEIFFV